MTQEEMKDILSMYREATKLAIDAAKAYKDLYEKAEQSKSFVYPQIFKDPVYDPPPSTYTDLTWICDSHGLQQE